MLVTSAPPIWAADVGLPHFESPGVASSATAAVHLSVGVEVELEDEVALVVEMQGKMRCYS